MAIVVNWYIIFLILLDLWFEDEPDVIVKLHGYSCEGYIIFLILLDLWLEDEPDLMVKLGALVTVWGNLWVLKIDH